MVTYETKQDAVNAAAVMTRLQKLMDCELVECDKFAPFDCILRFSDGVEVACEIKCRKGNMGEAPLNKTVWLSLHKRLAAQQRGLPFWFVVACDNGSFVWHDKGEVVQVDFTGRHGRPAEHVMQVPVSLFVKLPVLLAGL